MSGATGFIDYTTKGFRWVSSNDPLPVTVVSGGGGATGPGTAAAASRVTLASDDPLLSVLPDAGEYVAASQTDQILGATGAVGDFLSGLLIIPGTTSPGAVEIQDADGTARVVFTGGASSVSSLVPFFVPIQAKCTGATTPGWKVTTGANVTVWASGNFT